VVTGKVRGAARVMVGSVVAAIDREGHFNARVPLRDDKTALTVFASDISGREREVDLPLPAAPAAPALKTVAAKATPKGPGGKKAPPKPKGGFQWGVKR
jgi:hypothetical protein